MVLGEDYYLGGVDNVPAVFRDADRQIEASYRDRIIKRVEEPKYIPVPFIKGCPGAEGPIIVTEDWYVNEKKKRMAKKAKERKELQIEMMQLLSQRDRLRIKLEELDPSKKKDSKKIVAINEKLKNIDAELKMLQMESGVNLEALDQGTKFGRFVGRLKRTWKRAVKKVKKFYKRNKELIIGVAAIALPALFGGLVRKLVAALI